MSVKSELRSQLVDAMKSGDRARRDAIRSVQAEIQTRKTAPGFSGTGEDDDFYRQVIGAYVKKMRKAAAEYADLGERGKEMSEKLSFEAHFLSRWLPARLDEEQSRRLVRDAVALLGATGQPRAQGRVMGHIMKTHRQEVDGALISRLVAEELAAG